MRPTSNAECMPSTDHSPAVRRAHEQMLAGSRLTSRFLHLPSGARVHLVESGDGEPMLLLHGTTTSSLSHVPFLPELEGVRAINVDRAGHGLSDPMPLDPYREGAVRFIDEVADALGLDTFVLAGASMGGTCALWYALARPMRVRSLALLGASPLLPGTQPPMPIRALATPVIGELVSRLLRPTEANVVRFMRSMGEAETIVRHPALLSALAAAAGDPLGTRADRQEVRAIASPGGFRDEMRFTPAELGSLDIPVLLVWGADDPLGGADVARRVCELIPRAQLELLPTGHVPWLADPGRVATLLSRFATRR